MSNKRVFLDNASTTPIAPEIIDMMSEMMNYQVRARMNIIKQLEESRGKDEEKNEDIDKFNEVKDQIQEIFTS